jgi:hypothetical protein
MPLANEPALSAAMTTPSLILMDRSRISLDKRPTRRVAARPHSGPDLPSVSSGLLFGQKGAKQVRDLREVVAFRIERPVPPRLVLSLEAGAQVLEKPGRTGSTRRLVDRSLGLEVASRMRPSAVDSRFELLFVEAMLTIWRKTANGLVKSSVARPKTVRGSIAIAAITKHEGFQWVQLQKGFDASRI